MWKTATTGLIMLVTGAAKFAEHASRAPTLEDYLAFRCGPGATAMGTAAHSLLSNLHCWGCPVMAIGAGLLVYAGVRSFRPWPSRAASALLS